MPGPDVILRQYLTDWGHRDYKGMYDLLSEDAKKSISETSFVNRHEEIYLKIHAQSIALTPEIPNQFKPDGDSVVLRFEANWNTTITNPFSESYSATLVKDQSGWRINWSPQLIFPQLKQGWTVKAESLSPTRGSILAEDGEPLATNENALDIGFVPGKMKADSAKKLSQLLHISTDKIQSALHQNWVKPDLFVPVQTLSQSKEKPLEPLLLQIPGIEVSRSSEPIRVYPLGQSAAALTGYIGPISADELDTKHKQEGYTTTDYIGKQGLEAALEPELRGTTGGKIWIADNNGIQQTVLAQRQPVAGDNVTITIQPQLQKALDRALGNQVGSAVILDPTTGAVLAMASHPTFDPTQLMQGLTSEQWKQLLSAKNSPLIDRVLSTVPPGSALKPLVAGVALTDGVIKTSTTFPGTSKLTWQKDSSWGSYYVTRVPHPNGTVDLEHALIWSDNIYFAQVGLALGADRFTSELEQFGFGRTFPFPLQFDKSQLSDTGKIDSSIQLADSAYGQGQVLVSPLQLASMYTSFWNHGDVLQPYLIQEFLGSQTNDGQIGKRTVLGQQVIAPNAVREMQKDMRQVVADPTGTAHALAGLTNWSVEGKTGTAQTKAGAEWGWFSGVVTQIGQVQPKYLITMALANTQSEGGSHEAVSCVSSFLDQIQP